MSLTKLVIFALDLSFVILTVAELKCQPGDSRKIYDSCQLYYTDMTLWCDLTSYTKIPNPDDVQAFAPCSYATALYINNSCIEDIEPEQLRRYRRLEKLDCSDNFLQKLKNNTFSHSRKLLHIDLSDNNINEIETDSLKGLVHLRRLRMKRNKISQLSSTTFAPTPHLQEVHLDDNALVEVQLGVFSSLKNLQILSLQYNRMRRWAPEPHLKFPSLFELDLGHNLISVLERDALAAMPVLGRLGLRNNHITKVEENAFKHNRQLMLIDLRHNKLKTLPKHLFAELCKLKVLRLNGNFLQNPHPEWFVTVVQHPPIKDNSLTSFVSNNDWKCNCASAEYQAFVLFSSNQKSTSWLKLLELPCPEFQTLRAMSLDNCSKVDPNVAEMMIDASRSFCKSERRNRKLLSKQTIPHNVPTDDDSTDRGLSAEFVAVVCVIVAVAAMVATLILFIWWRKKTQQSKLSAKLEEDSTTRISKDVGV